MTDLLLVEKVAKAIYDATHAGLSNCYAWDGDRLDMNLTRDDITTVATAAIAAMEAHRPPVTVASLYGYEAGLVEGFKQGIEAAAKVCEEQRASFLSEEYAVGQPMSSLMERFACGECITAIRALSPPSIADDGKEGAG